MDDLPRTLRREREARERARTPGYKPSQIAAGPPAGSFVPGRRQSSTLAAIVPEPTMPEHFVMSGNTVTDIRIPFFRLMMFCFKLVFAAIPALILLLALLWLGRPRADDLFPVAGEAAAADQGPVRRDAIRA